MKNIISVYPLSTEKAYKQVKENIYVFNVPVSANKQEIAKAIETQFEVKVAGIKTLVQDGKAMRYSKGKHSQPGMTVKKDTKKAYVKLVNGDSIKVFEEVEAEPAKAEKKKEKK
jgi:large subunit ribosomal protein L23